MKFNEMNYERPDQEVVLCLLREKLELLKKAESAEQFLPVFWEINTINAHVKTMMTLAQVRYTINTADPFYDQENAYWDEHTPEYQAVGNEVVKVALEKPYRSDLLKEIPETYFKLAECSLRSFNEKIIPLKIEENKLMSQYGRLKASAAIEFDGKTLNLAQIVPYTQSTDRSVRKAAEDAKMAFYAEHEQEFDEIYDRMVHLRDQMAKELGYSDYHKMSFDVMTRMDYNADMVRAYRKAILDYVTPAAVALVEKQGKRLGIEEPCYYDLNMQFADGNAKPVGTAEDLIQDAVQMYHELSKETGEFIDVMVQNELWDLIARPNKQMGGYMTDLTDYKVPFIFSNFNGTSGDVDVLTHEAGHSFQYYMARDIKLIDVAMPTMESCEIHSMSMEFFAYPWMPLFFGAQTDRYRFAHTAGTLMFLPYGVLVDHFQEEVYTHPDWTPQERKACWRELEKQYLPFRKYDGCKILEEGCFWYQQNHIFQSPFYYIDYTLAQVCAQQFYIRMLDEDQKAWPDYLALCRLGGTKTFTKLVQAAGLKSPFEKETIPYIVERLMHVLNAVDDRAL